MTPHPKLCACDDCFDKPIKPRKKRVGHIGRPPDNLLGAGFKYDPATPPKSGASPLHEAIKTEIKAYLGRVISTEEDKIIDLTIMQLLAFQKRKELRTRARQKERRELIIIT